MCCNGPILSAIFQRRAIRVFEAVETAASTRGLLFDTLVTSGMPSITRHDVLKWARKSGALACQNLATADGVVSLNTCPRKDSMASGLRATLAFRKNVRK